MLTVDYPTFDLEPGATVLDMGCGAGRHAFESLRRGGRVVAFDYSLSELQDVTKLFWAMGDAGEVGSKGEAGAVRGDALKLPFRDNSFDRIIASEVLEHLADDVGAIAELTRVLKPGGIIAITVPSWLPEKVCWALSAEYHAPLAEGGHLRIYTEEQLRARMSDGGLDVGRSHHAHALHSPYWWLKCAVGPTNSEHPLVKAYHRLLVWDISKAPKITRVTERLLNPIIGKSVVVYATKPASLITANAPSNRTGNKGGRRRVAA